MNCVRLYHVTQSTKYRLHRISTRLFYLQQHTIALYMIIPSKYVQLDRLRYVHGFERVKINKSISQLKIIASISQHNSHSFLARHIIHPYPYPYPFVHSFSRPFIHSFIIRSFDGSFVRVIDLTFNDLCAVFRSFHFPLSQMANVFHVVSDK